MKIFLSKFILLENFINYNKLLRINLESLKKIKIDLNNKLVKSEFIFQNQLICRKKLSFQNIYFNQVSLIIKFIKLNFQKNLYYLLKCNKNHCKNRMNQDQIKVQFYQKMKMKGKLFNKKLRLNGLQHNYQINVNLDVKFKINKTTDYVNYLEIDFS